MICHMTCGCIIEKSKLTRHKKRFCCPEHKDGRIRIFESECSECGKLVKSKNHFAPREYCDECKIKKKKQQDKRARDKYRGKEPDEIILAKAEAAQKTYDCVYRSDCLDIHRKLKVLPCFDCKRYTKFEHIISI